MSIKKEIPGFESIFGELDFKKGADARSVYSPAAYLTDLLQLLDDYFEKDNSNDTLKDFDKRRADIKEIFLNGENTYNVIPYLDIVNDLLEKKVGEKPYQTLRQSTYPFNLPFNREIQEAKKMFGFLGIKPEDLYKLFSITEKSKNIAKLSLALSDENFDLLFKRESNSDRLKAHYNNQNFYDLLLVDTFLKTTSLSFPQLNELLYQNESGVESERMKDFYINSGLNGYASLDDAKEYIIWNDNNDFENEDIGLPLEWFDRANRSIRLAGITQTSLKDVDWMIRHCCRGKLDENAVVNFAIIKQLQNEYEFSTESLCALIGNLKKLSVFENEDFDALRKPVPFSAIENKIYRLALGRALNSTEKDLLLIAERCLNKSTTPDEERVVIFRMVTLADKLDLNSKELIDLLDVFNKDPMIWIYEVFNTLIHSKMENIDCYWVLTKGSPGALMWLVQNLLSAGKWMSENQFSASELKYIQSGKLPDEKAEKVDSERQLNTFDAIYQQFKASSLTSKILESERFSPRSARVVVECLTDSSNGLVSENDSRLLNFNQKKAEMAAYKALKKFGTIKRVDFLNLGIEEKMQNKIFDNLVIKGYLKADGRLVESAFPVNQNEFKINNSNDTETEAVFNVLHQIFQEEAEVVIKSENETNGNGHQIELEDQLNFSLFFSDLNKVNLPEVRQKEVYDNLIFNGYLDVEGHVLKPGFFAEPANIEKFEVNANIDSYSDLVYKLILAKTSRYKKEPLVIKPTLFEALNLREIEVTDLLENLRFNDYLAADNSIIEKDLLRNLELGAFKLALQFYPHRTEILEVLQNEVERFRAAYYTFAREEVNEIAKGVVADLVNDHMKESHLKDGMFTEEGLAFFKNETNISKFQPGVYFDENTIPLVFNAIVELIKTSEEYKILPLQIENLGLSPEETTDIITELVNNKYLDEELRLLIDKRDFFLNINNALGFEIEGFEDYNKDVFFVLHSTAKKVAESIEEIVSKYKGVKEAQDQGLLQVLQEGFELPSNKLSVLFDHVFGIGSNWKESILLPLVQTANEDGIIDKIPQDKYLINSFNRIKQFAFLAEKLNLSASEIDVLFVDQNLNEKFPEDLVLPEGHVYFDSLLKLWLSADDILNINRQTAENFSVEVEADDFIEVIAMLNLQKETAWLYDGITNERISSSIPISSILYSSGESTQIDAAFNDSEGNAWIVSGADFYCKIKKGYEWKSVEKQLGKQKSNFEQLNKVESSYLDSEGKIYLFAGDQYVRFSDGLNKIDEGYPKRIKGNWERENNFELADPFKLGIDASFESPEGELYFFKEDKFVSSEDFKNEKTINDYWGRVKSNFENLDNLDASFSLNGKVYLFSGNQVITYSDSLESSHVLANEGSIKKIKSVFKDLNEVFYIGIDSVFYGIDGNIHFFKDNHYQSLSKDFELIGDNLESVNSKWGLLQNNILVTGEVNAAFSGLDGNVYIFSGTQYYRYSGHNYSKVDEGYPRLIKEDWGGLNQVDSAFVLNGKTYLFGTDENSEIRYTRYSSNDYSIQDHSYPQPPIENWWNLPFELIQSGFSTPDSIFVGQEGKTYLTKADDFVFYDSIHRWWSEPAKLNTLFTKLTFKKLDAGFTGKDGRTYLFSNKQFVRYSDKNYNKFDLKFPKEIDGFWGNVSNNIQSDKRIDSSLVLDAQSNGSIQKRTYLFSGNQFFRYSKTDYTALDQGYPKSLDKLVEEPRFEEMKMDLKSGINAAFSDQRNVYLFSNNNCHVFSDTIYKEYKNLLDAEVHTAVMESGKIFIEDQVGWQALNNPEGTGVINGVSRPGLLDKAEPKFREGLDAILEGTDENTYFFNKEGFCYNETLRKSYPTREAWGHIQNNIFEEEKVDTGFVGLDGKVYLFSGEQFVTYSQAAMPAALDLAPGETDGHPQSIKEFWGLDSVQLAFVKDEKTYLFEHANDQGVIRYVCLNGAEYANSDKDPISTDFSYWNIPEAYVEDGFSRVDGVIFEQDNMFLFYQDEFVQYNSTDDIWTYPRPISLIWGAVPFKQAGVESITTVFTGPNNLIFFFFEKHYVACHNKVFSNLYETKSHWGKSKNNIIKTGLVDAAFVNNEGATYLFSGDQYYKYTNSDYEFVDEGYPKLVEEELKNEEGFQNLQETFNDKFKLHGKIDGITGNERSVFIFMDRDCCVVSTTTQNQFDLDRIGNIKNNIQETNRVDASFSNESGDTFLIAGDQYFLYKNSNYAFVEEGYPKLLGHMLSEWESTDREKFVKGVDAAFVDQAGILMLFKDAHYAKVEKNATAKMLLELLNDGEVSFEVSANKPVDTAFVSPDGKAYFLRGKYCIAYENLNDEFVSEGFPKQIDEVWGHLPVAFQNGVDSGFVFNGKSYLRNIGHYVRYSGKNFAKMDATFPQLFATKWNKWGDYLLTDIKLINQFTKLNNTFRSDDFALVDLLDSKKTYIKESFAVLAELFDWDEEEVKWIKRNNAFLEKQSDFEVRFNAELIIKMEEIFRMSSKAGTSPSNLYKKLYQPLFESNEMSMALKDMSNLLKINNSKSDWDTLSKQFHNEMNLLKRDAMLPYVINKDTTVENARELFAKMLLDVEMGSDAMTSKVKEAIGALQLYFHRYFVRLEDLELDDKVERKDLKQWWSWMKNYRVWEANRKVFLYPENYIRPELRSNKSEAFKNLETALLQGELTEELISSSFNNYLTEFEAVGNLKITGANEYKDGDDTILMLFGHTRTEPMQYYYRTARFIEDKSVIWENWEKLDININSTRVFPVFAFGRMLVFWTEIETHEESKPVIVSKTSESTKSTIDTSDKVFSYRADIKYSFYNFNKKWINPQRLFDQPIKLDYNIDAAYIINDEITTFSGKYCLQATKQNPSGNIKTIKEVFTGNTKLPENFYFGIDAAVVVNNIKYFFRDGICASPGDTVGRPIGSLFESNENLTSDAPAFIFLTAHLIDTTRITAYEQGVAAAFATGNTVCLIDNHGAYNFFKWNATSKTFKEVGDLYSGNSFWLAFIRILTHNLLKLDPVDAVFEDSEAKVLYVLRNGQYSCYKHEAGSIEVLKPLEGFPKPIKGNLTFNMDKFFNKLHVVNVNDKYINLEYVIPDMPEEAILISGKVLPDFEFKETEVRDIIKKSFLVRAESGLGGYLKLNESTNDVVKKLTSIKDKFDVLNKDATDLVLVTKNLNHLENATNLDKDKVTDELNKISFPTKDENGIFVSNYAADFVTIETLKTGLESALKVKKKADQKTAIESANQSIETNVKQLRLKQEPRENAKGEEFYNTNYQLSQINHFWDIRFYKNANIFKNELTKLRDANLDSNLLLDTEKFEIVKNGFNTLSTNGLTLQNAKDEIFKITQEELLLLDKLPLSFGILSSWINNAIKTFDPNQKKSLDHVKKKSKEYGNKLEMHIKKTILIVDPPSGNADSINKFNEYLVELDEGINTLREIHYGRFDMFPSAFDIKNTSNFTFSQPDWFIFEEKGGTFLCRPPLPPKKKKVPSNGQPVEGETSNELSTIVIPRRTKYEIHRLTTNAIPELSNRLFAYGIDGFLTLTTQMIDEQPHFRPNNEERWKLDKNVALIPRQLFEADKELMQVIDFEKASNIIDFAPSMIAVDKKVGEFIEYKVPKSIHLDYKGANSNYYWEIFYHTPFLIANALNNAQKFEEAKKWYEYIFDPASEFGPWQFLPLVENSPEYKTTIEEHLTNPSANALLDNELQAYREDPFDPHAIARLRNTAYPKAILMSYIDNLLDWGDMLFRQYTMESINEARMLYVLANDLLGDKPENVGEKDLPKDDKYKALSNAVDVDEILFDTVHASTSNPYFHIPVNDVFMDYWNRVEDRLYKIRNSLNIDGIKQALPLFQPPIDPMALVQAAASGAGIGQALAQSNVAVPHFRFDFMIYKARELQQKLSQFGGELLNAIEKRDSEALSLLQSEHEHTLMGMMKQIKLAQIEEAETNIQHLNESLKFAERRVVYNEETVKEGLIAEEEAQIGIQIAASAMHYVAAILKVAASFGSATPDAMIGPFIMGIKIGGSNVGDAFSTASEAIQSVAEGTSLVSEILGIYAQHKRSVMDWEFEVETAQSDINQIKHQIKGAEIQKLVATYELAVHEKEMEQQDSIRTFMKGKFANKELYSWMAGKLSGIYFQTYKMALDMAKAAEKAFIFERGLKESEVNYIGGMYWDSQKKGLLAGESLGLDIDRLEKAFIETNKRRFEITKAISLLELNPKAYLDLRTKGSCEFSFSESVLDYDFQGHYCRQVKSISVSFNAGEGQTVNATLTQLHHKTVLKPDVKAVKYLLDPKGEQPATIRSNWRPLQQIALSHVDDYETNNGLFELRFDDEQYLPFEGTGAVSTWRLELNGKRGSYNPDELLDVIITLKYTAMQGGSKFASDIKGLLKPYQTAQYFDLNYNFHDKWINFINNEDKEVTLTFTKDHFPNMSSSKITGIFAKFDLLKEGPVTLELNGNENMILKNNKVLETPGLSISTSGSAWTFRVKGDKSILKNVLLIMGYKARV